MNITVDKESLCAALALAVTVADRKNANQTLTCALLRADGGLLTVAASDLSITYVTKIACIAKEPGALALDAKSLHDIVASSTSSDVAIRVVDGKAELRAGKSRFQLATQAVEHFPAMPNESALQFAPVDAKQLARAAAAVEFCSDPTDSNLAFQGVYVDFTAGIVQAASRVRGAMFSSPLGEVKGAALLSRKGLAAMLKVAGKDAEVAMHGGEIFLRSDRTLVAAKVIDAPFPTADEKVRLAYFRPKSDYEVIVGRVRFADAVRRVSLVTAKDLQHDVRLSIVGNKASLASRSAVLGIAEDEIDVSYSGPSIECAISADQAVGALDAMTSDEVTLGFNENKQYPILLRPTAEEMGEEHAVLMMPVNRG